jgi:hypothetical protein
LMDDESKLTRRTTTYVWTKLESVEATFPASGGERTKLTITIEQAEGDFHDGKGFTDREIPRMRINPSHGFAGYSRAESVWIEQMIPKLWQEWETRVAARKGPLLCETCSHPAWCHDVSGCQGSKDALCECQGFLAARNTP